MTRSLTRSLITVVDDTVVDDTVVEENVRTENITDEEGGEKQLLRWDPEVLRQNIVIIS
jgi:hypothetical protein